MRGKLWLWLLNLLEWIDLFVIGSTNHIWQPTPDSDTKVISEILTGYRWVIVKTDRVELWDGKGENHTIFGLDGDWMSSGCGFETVSLDQLDKKVEPRDR